MAPPNIKYWGGGGWEYNKIVIFSVFVLSTALIGKNWGAEAPQLPPIAPCLYFCCNFCFFMNESCPHRWEGSSEFAKCIRNIDFTYFQVPNKRGILISRGSRKKFRKLIKGVGI